MNSIKDGKSGTIERSDVVREILFHFSDCVVKSGADASGNETTDLDNPPIDLGDDVEFTIQTR